MAWVKLLDLKEVSRWYPDRGVGAEYEGSLFAVFREGDSYYVLDDICSHEYARLSEGEVCGDSVYCPKHGSCFNIKTGAVRGLPATKPVKAHKTRVEENFLYIEIE